MQGEELVTLSDAKVKLFEVVRGLPKREALLLRYGKPVAALLDYNRYTALLQRIEDLEDRLAIFEARDEDADMMVPLEKVKAEAGLAAGPLAEK